MGLLTAKAPTATAVYSRLYAPDLSCSIARLDAPKGRKFLGIQAELEEADPNALAFRITRSLRGREGAVQAGHWAIVGATDKTPGDFQFRTVFPIRGRFVEVGEYDERTSSMAYVVNDQAVELSAMSRIERETLYLAAAAEAIHGYINGDQETQQMQVNVTYQEQ